MNANEHLELFLTLNTEAFKKALGDTGAAVGAMSGKAGTALGGMSSGADGAEKSVKRLGDSAATGGKKVEKLGEKARKAEVDTSVLGRTAETVTAKLTKFLAGLAAIGKPVLEAAGFERKMAEIGAITGAATDTLDKMSKRAQELGRQTEFSAAQAAEGMKMLSMAGLTAEQSIAAIGPALDLALVGGIELGASADYITNIMGGLGLSIADLSRITDVLANTSTRSNSTVTELAEAMKYAAPAAAALGIPLEEAAAAMGVLHDNGIKGTMAGTSMRTMLAKLASQTKEAEETLQQMGVQVARNNDGSVDFVATMQRLRDANMGLAEANKIFGTEAGTAAIVMSRQIDSVERLAKANEDAAGKAREMAKLINDNLTGSWLNFQSAVSGLAIALGTHLLPVLAGVLDVLTGTLNLVTDLATAYPGITKVVVLLVAALVTLKGAALAARLAMLALGGVKGPLKALSPVLKLLGVDMAALASKANLLSKTKLSGWASAAMGQLGKLKGVLTSSVGSVGLLSKAFGVLGAATAGWAVGTWANKEFAIVQKAGVGMAYSLDRIGLAAQKMWAILTGGDVEAVNRKIEIAKDALDKSYEEIDRKDRERKEAKDKEEEETTADRAKKEAEAKPETEPVTEAPVLDTEAAEKKKDPFATYLTDKEAARKKQEADDVWRKKQGLPSRAEEKAAADPETKAQAEAEAAEAAREKARKKEESDRKKAAASEKAANDEAELERRMKAAEEEKYRLAEQKKREEEQRREKEALEDEATAQERAARKKKTGHGYAPKADAAQEPIEKKQFEPIGKAADETSQAVEQAAEQSERAYRDSQEAMLADSTADARAAAETDALDQSKTGWQTYADNVKRIQDDIAGREKSLADELNQLGGRHRSEEQGWRAKAKAAKEYQKAAEEAMKAGNLEEAQALADQAKDAYRGLAGGAGKVGAAQGDRAAFMGVKSAGELGLAISKALQQSAAKNALQALPADAGLGDLGATVRGRLAAIADGQGGTGDGTTGAGGAAKVHELRFAGGSLRGGEQDVEALLQVLAKAGMTTA
jgi:TP901 family phage tail tape measure protein